MNAFTSAVSNFVNKVINLYNTNQTFHSFVSGLEGTLIAAVVSYSGGSSNGKTAIASFVSFIGMTAYGFIRKWLVDNATVIVPLTKKP